MTMDKQLRPAADAATGAPVRLLSGAWDDICAVVAAELRARTDENAAQELPLDAAILLFSTSRKAAELQFGRRAVARCDGDPGVAGVQPAEQDGRARRQPGA